MDYGYAQQPNGNFYDSGSNWMRKYDYENQKEYFIAHTPPTPSECCDFEVPQQVAQSVKPTSLKLFNDIDKIFFDDRDAQKTPLHINNNSSDSCDAYNFWDPSESVCNEKASKKNIKCKEKSNCENFIKSERGIKRIAQDEG